MRAAYCNKDGGVIYFVHQIHADWWVGSKRRHCKTQNHSKFGSEAEALKRLAEMARERKLVEVKL